MRRDVEIQECTMDLPAKDGNLNRKEIRNHQPKLLGKIFAIFQTPTKKRVTLFLTWQKTSDG